MHARSQQPQIKFSVTAKGHLVLARPPSRRRHVWQGHCDDDDDDVIEDKDMNKAIARTIARPYGLKAVPGGDPMEADIGCYKHVCKDECDRRVYICNDCNLLDYMPTLLKEQEA